jgi:Kef-type K+ transport system membrane component KefB
VGGFAIGPAGFGLVQGQESVSIISELGLIFLLFMIGLEIDLKKIISAGTSILVTAASQILGGTLAGVGFFYLIGFPITIGQWDALYLGIAAALSSTVIIVKMLYDKRELDTLPGRITLGILVLQDLFVIVFLAVQPSLDELEPGAFILSLVRVIVLVASSLAISRFVLPPLFRSVTTSGAGSVGALAWCFGRRACLRAWAFRDGPDRRCIDFDIPYALDVTAKVTSLRFLCHAVFRWS